MEIKLLNHSSCSIYIPFYNLGHGHIHINYSAFSNILMNHI